MVINKLRKLLPVSILVVFLCALSSGQTETNSTPAPAAGKPVSADSETTRTTKLLERVRQRIQKYHESLFSIAVTEVVRQQELRSDATTKGKPRGMVYESVTLHRQSPAGVQDAVPIITRTLKSIDGKPAKQPTLPKRSKCVDISPAPAYADPLTFLLSDNPFKWNFAYMGETILAGRKAAMVSINAPPPAEPIKLLDKGDCFVLSRGLQKKGVIWIDLESYDVLQLQWQLAESFSGKLPAGVTKVGILPVFRKRRDVTFEKADFIIRFRPTTFKDPEQTLLLPTFSESTWVIKGAGIAGYQTIIDYTRYRRFKSSVEVKESDGIEKP